MEARVQILPLDRPTANGSVYPRAVMEAALRKLAGKSLAVTHVNSFRGDGVPKMSESLGVASDLVIDDSTNTLIARVHIKRVPDDLKDGYVLSSAGFGDVVDGTVTEFTLSCVILARA